MSRARSEGSGRRKRKASRSPSHSDLGPSGRKIVKALERGEHEWPAVRKRIIKNMARGKMGLFQLDVFKPGYELEEDSRGETSARERRIRPAIKTTGQLGEALGVCSKVALDVAQEKDGGRRRRLLDLAAAFSRAHVTLNTQRHCHAMLRNTEPSLEAVREMVRRVREALLEPHAHRSGARVVNERLTKEFFELVVSTACQKFNARPAARGVCHADAKEPGTCNKPGCQFVHQGQPNFAALRAEWQRNTRPRRRDTEGGEREPARGEGGRQGGGRGEREDGAHGAGRGGRRP